MLYGLEFKRQFLYDVVLRLGITPLQKINSYLLLSLFSLVLLLPGQVNLPVVDRDEAHFAQASRQMMQTGQYFQIRFQEHTRFQKPPGINWLQAVSVKLWSHADSSAIWPYRFPSLLSGLLSVLLTFFFARRLINQRVAFLAGMLLASALLLVVEAHMAVIDATLLLSVIVMQGALWIIYQAGMEHKPVAWGWALLFWLAMAFGTVLKGVTPLIGLFSVLTLCLLERQIVWLRSLHVFKGVLLFLLLNLIWVLLVNTAENSNYLVQLFQKAVLPKLLGGHESHGKPPLFHALILPMTCWPASLFLWQGGVYAFHNKHQRVERFLLAWILPTWIFFEIMPTKLPQYVLPTFPAIALFLALAVTKARQGEKPSAFLRLLQVLWGVMSLCFALSVASLPYILMQEVTLLSIMVFMGISFMSLVSVYFAFRGQYYRASVAVLFSALVSYPIVFAGLLPQLKPIWISRNVAQLINKKYISNQNPLLVIGNFEPSLVFYLNTKQVFYTGVEDATKIILQKPNSLLLVDQPNYRSLLQANPLLRVIASTTGFDYNHGRWVRLILLGPRSLIKEKKRDAI